MKPTFITNIIASSLFCFGLTAAASAQPPDRPSETRPSGTYDSRYGAFSRTDFQDSQILFSHVRTDLDRAESNLRPFGDSQPLFDRVRGELSELQRQWDENTYQPSQVDVVIRALDRAVRSPELSTRDRDRLTSDLDNLRQFRDDHE